MSTPISPLPEAQAHNLVHTRLYAPVFFTKLARDFGIRPTSEADGQRMLHMAAQLRAGHDQHQTKQAAQSVDLLSAAQAHLDRTLASNGMSAVTSNSTLVKQAASELCNDPELAHAILSMHVATANHAA